MAKRIYPTKTERSRKILGETLTAFQTSNPESDIVASLKAVRKETTRRFQAELDMTPECANTYFQSRKGELVSALAPVKADAVVGSTATTSLAN